MSFPGELIQQDESLVSGSDELSAGKVQLSLASRIREGEKLYSYVTDICTQNSRNRLENQEYPPIPDEFTLQIKLKPEQELYLDAINISEKLIVFVVGTSFKALKLQAYLYPGISSLLKFLIEVGQNLAQSILVTSNNFFVRMYAGIPVQTQGVNPAVKYPLTGSIARAMKCQPIYQYDRIVHFLIYVSAAILNGLFDFLETEIEELFGQVSNFAQIDIVVLLNGFITSIGKHLQQVNEFVTKALKYLQGILVGKDQESTPCAVDKLQNISESFKGTAAKLKKGEAPKALALVPRNKELTMVDLLQIVNFENFSLMDFLMFVKGFCEVCNASFELIASFRVFLVKKIVQFLKDALVTWLIGDATNGGLLASGGGAHIVSREDAIDKNFLSSKREDLVKGIIEDPLPY